MQQYCIFCNQNTMVYDEKRDSLICNNCKLQIQSNMYMYTVQRYFKQVYFNALKLLLVQNQTLCIQHDNKFLLVGHDSNGDPLLLLDQTIQNVDVGKRFLIQE